LRFESLNKIKEISRELGVSEEELIRKGVKTYLQMELRKARAEIHSMLSKYNVKSFEELDEKISTGKLSETDTFEDFTRLDYLEATREKNRKATRCDKLNDEDVYEAVKRIATEEFPDIVTRAVVLKRSCTCSNGDK